MFVLLFTVISLADAVTLNGSSEYTVPGTDFTLMCDAPEVAMFVQFYRRPNVTSPVGGVQVGNDQCYNVWVSPASPCTPDVCSCVTSGVNLGTVFRWIIQPQTGDHESVWYCRRTNYKLLNPTLDSQDYTLKIAVRSNSNKSTCDVYILDQGVNRGIESARRQGKIEQPIKFSNVLKAKDETTPDRTDEMYASITIFR
ncbi:uncharacterized protein LOC117340421 [Pecten maximus]|uniref:uncharacterized protein LOC117340421 n=1 Tax=Pecten maximus TaxID=6579 RepID=UPI001458884E|nr:uncharacterized protein LOC117340421 [Pecten maximus]